MRITHFRRSLLLGLTVVAGLGLSLAAVRLAAAEKKGPDVTVYNGNLALVKESRQFDLDAGVNTVNVTDVPSSILPETVVFKSLTDADAVVLEQNYEYDIVGSEKLLQKYIDQSIELLTEDGAKYGGKLLSAAGDVVLQAEDGSVQVIRFDKIRQFSFPALPEGLITKPTLVWTVNAGKAGQHDVELAYLTYGMNWQANYVAVLATDNKSLDWTGWITLDNNSGATYKDARLKLVAGNINRAPVEMVKEFAYAREVAVEAPMPTPQVEQRQFFEYHLYELQRPVTIKNNQTKQVEFITKAGVLARKEYVYDGSQPYPGFAIYDPGYGNTGSTEVRVVVIFNTGKEGLDAQIPQGNVRIYQADEDGSPLLIGEDNIKHTPKGEDVTLHIGTAFDLVAERKQTDYKQISDKVVEETYTIELRNRKEAEDVQIRVVEHLSRGTNWEILKSLPEGWKKTDSATVEWVVPVKAQDKATITYTVRYTF